MERLGERLNVATFAVRGPVNEALAWSLVWGLIAALRMNEAPGATACWYPLPGGKGGLGFTLFQPITESFIAVDAWPDHGGAYVVICSCRPFNTDKVLNVFIGQDLTVIESNEHNLSLKDMDDATILPR